MSLTLTVQVDGADGALAALDRFAVFDEHRPELLEGLGRIMEVQHQRRIEREHTTPAGQPFAPVQRGGTPLFDTGKNLADAFYYEVSDPEVRVSNNFVGAAVHHFGAVITPKTADALVFSMGGQVVFSQRVIIPRRPFMGVSADNLIEIIDTIEAFITGLAE